MSKKGTNIKFIEAVNYNNNLELIDAVDFLKKFIDMNDLCETKLKTKEEQDNVRLLFLENRTERNIFFKDSLIMISTLLMSLFKEDIIDTNTNKILINRYSYDCISRLFKLKNGLYYIGDIAFDSSIEAFSFLRNKLLHGDFIIQDDSIVISRENINGTLKFRDLLLFCTSLSVVKDCNSKTFNYNFVLREQKYLFQKISIDVTMKGKKTVNHEIIEFIMRQAESLKNISDNNQDSFSIYYFCYLLAEKFNRQFSNARINIKIEDIEDEIRNKVFDNYFKSPNRPEEIRYDQITKSLEDEINEKNYALSCLAELVLLIQAYLDCPKEKNYTNYYKANQAYHLVKFYSLFNYGLDGLIANTGGVKLLDILEKTKLDFSKLDLAKFYDKNMTVDYELIKPTEKEKQDYLTYYEKMIVNEETRYKNYMEKSTTKSKEIIEKFKNNIVEYKEKNNVRKEKIENIDSFNEELFVRNLNIIEHIRNCFAHGNYSFIINDYFDDSKNYIKFFDFYKGNLTYECTVSIDEFSKMLECSDLIKEVLNNNVKVDESILNIKVMGESESISDERKKEWRNYVNSSKNDKKEVKKIKIIKYYLDELTFTSFITPNQKNANRVMGLIFAELLKVSIRGKEDNEVVKLQGEEFTLDEYYDILEKVIYYIKDDTVIKYIADESEDTKLKEIYEKVKLCKKRLIKE